MLLSAAAGLCNWQSSYLVWSCLHQTMAEVERSESNGSLDSARSSADEEPQQVEVEVGKFAEILEGQKWVRSLLYKSEPGKDHFTAWGEAKMVGVISIKAMALNHQALELAALWWCPLFDFPQCIPVQVMRQEVGFWGTPDFMLSYC